MPLFGLGRKNDGFAAKPRLEPGDGDPVALALIAAANRYDWPTVRSILARHRDEDLSSLLTGLANNALDARDWLIVEQDETPDDPLLQAALGAATVGFAWRVRTGKRSQHVSQDQFEKFHALLREGEEHLYRAAELDPASPAPWAELVTSGRGLQMGPDIVRRRFEAVIDRYPAHRPAYRSMLQTLCKKWSGSDEQMHEFAAAAAAGPHWAALAHLVAIGHLERWYELPVGTERSAYMKQPDVRKELTEAADLSIFQPGWSHPRSPYLEPNLFAMTLSLAGLHGEARRAFELTDGVVTRFPWSYGNGRDQVGLFTVWRDKARSARSA